MEPVVLSGWSIGLSIGTILAAGAAVVALIIAAKQLGAATKQAEEIRKQTDTLTKLGTKTLADDFIKRFNDPNLIPIKTDAISFLENPRSDLTILWDTQNPDHLQLKSKVVLMGNFLEELAIMWNRDLVDKEIIKAFFRKISPRYYRYAAPYIQEESTRSGHPELWGEWRTMNADLEST